MNCSRNPSQSATRVLNLRLYLFSTSSNVKLGIEDTSVLILVVQYPLPESKFVNSKGTLEITPLTILNSQPFDFIFCSRAS